MLYEVITRQLLTGAVRRPRRPGAQGDQFPGLAGIKQPGFGTGSFQPAPAQIVAASLDQFDAKLQAAGPLQKGEILAEQLLLQVDGVGRDHHPFFVGQGPEQGRNQVGSYNFV